MERFFHLDGRAARLGTLLWSMILLNLWTLLGCLPVITAGASLTAMQYVFTRLIRNEEDGSLWSMFRRAFVSNFRQATALWLMFVLVFMSFRLDWAIIDSAPEVLGPPFRYAVLTAAWLVFMLLQFVFPLQSHFENTVLMTLRNAAVLSFSKLWRTLVMALSWAASFALLRHSLSALPVVLMLGLSLPGYVCARLCDPVFRQLEPEAPDELTGADAQP